MGETALLVRAVVSNSRGVASIVGAVDAERIELIEAALDAVGDVPSADRARLLAQLSAEVTYAGDNAAPSLAVRRSRRHGARAW